MKTKQTLLAKWKLTNDEVLDIWAKLDSLSFKLDHNIKYQNLKMSSFQFNEMKPLLKKLERDKVARSAKI